VPLHRQDVSDAVLAVIQSWHFDTPITEEMQFGVDLPLDKKAKGLYYYAIRLSLEKLGYVFCDFKAEDCEGAETIGDIIDAVWDDVNPESKRVM
jgi:hypothetical protein